VTLSFALGERGVVRGGEKQKYPDHEQSRPSDL